MITVLMQGGKRMGDYISRQMAIDALRTCYDTETITMDNGDEYINYDDAVGEIEQLPSIQPECPKGRWVPTVSGKGRHECSRCHEYAPCYQDGSEHLSTFCVLCGAKMEGGK